MEGFRWKRADEADDFSCLDVRSREIIYARTYTVGQSYSHSETNRVVINLKKTLDRSSRELDYKERAINQFATELAALLARSPTKKFTLIPVPPSKRKDHPEFDDRLDRVAARVAQRCDNVDYIPLLVGTVDREARHQGHHFRNVQESFDSMGIDERYAGRCDLDSILVVLDDVTTSGASFEAAYRHLSARFPGSRVVLLAWAKAIKLPAASDFEAVP